MGSHSKSARPECGGRWWGQVAADFGNHQRWNPKVDTASTLRTHLGDFLISLPLPPLLANPLKTLSFRPGESGRQEWQVDVGARPVT